MMRRMDSESSRCLVFLACLIIVLATAAPAAAQVQAQGQAQSRGRLCLISMGAGDRDNITVRAQKAVAAADVVLAGKHLAKKFADLLEGKEVHEIGHALFKKNCPHRMANPAAFEARERETRDLVRQAVAAGKTVAVLDGGDPTIYGPHAGFLTEFTDLDLEIVPGLSCFNAANAALRRGITGGVASRSVILTGGMGDNPMFHCKDTLAKLGETQSTMVVFTMRVKLPQVVERLKQTYPGDTPVAIVCQAGYRDKEKVIRATLDTILEATKDRKLPFEHLIYVGDFMK